jgi:hypothetical protein
MRYIVTFLPLVIIGIPLLALYFIPALIAAARHSGKFWWILSVNLLLGWTAIGWVASLIWALREARYAVAPPPAQPYNL